MEPSKNKEIDDPKDKSPTTPIQSSELALICYVPVMMSCQTTVHLYTYSRIEEEFNANKGFSSAYQNLIHTLSGKQEVQRLTSMWMTNTLSVEYFISIFSVLLIHLISEAFGRKIGILVSLSGTIGKVVLIAAMMFFKLPLDVLYVACALNGVTGGTGTFITGIVSHISDVNQDGKPCFDRISRVLALAIGMSGVFTIFFGYVMTYSSYLVVSVCLVNLTIFSAIIIIFRTEQSQPKDSSQTGSTKKSSFRDLWEMVPTRKFLLLFFFLSMAAFSYLPAGGQTIFVTQFFINKSFHSRDSIAIGIYMGIFAFSFYITYFFASMATKENISSNTIIIGGLLLGFICSVLLSLTMRMFFYQAVLVNNLVVYTVMYFIGKELSLLVDVRLHGHLYAILFSINSFATSLTLPFLNMIYKKTFNYFPGALYFAYAAFFLIAAAFQLGVWFYDEDKKRSA